MDSDKKLNRKLLTDPDADADTDAGVTTIARLFFLGKVELISKCRELILIRLVAFNLVTTIAERKI